MPLPTIADCYRVAFEWMTSTGGRTAANVMHFSAPGLTAQQVGDTIIANATLSMWSTVTSVARVRKLVISPLDGDSVGLDVIVPDADALKLTGNGGTDYTPQAAGIVKLQTGIPGRSNRGRVFLPFQSEQGTTGGVIDSDIVSAVTGAWVTFANNMADDDCALGVASYKNSLWHQALAVSLSNYIGTQKRRQDRIRNA